MMISSKVYCSFGIVIFFLVSLVLHTLASPMVHSCRHDQRDALLEFKHEFPVNESNPSALSSWNKTSDCCFWSGISCDAKSGEVISLSLSSIPLNNSLKPNSGLFKLHHLRSLTLFRCDLYGEIPSSLGNFSHLTHLDLCDNYLGGENLASVGNLTQLRYLDLGGNNFSGKIPASLGNFSHLEHLDLYANHLGGEVLASVGNLTQLRYLSLGDNDFSGNITASFANLTKLSLLDISWNPFTVTGESFFLLLDMISRFHNLEVLDVGGNSFSGDFPTSLFTIPSLTKVNLRDNQFKGPIEFRNISSSSKLYSLELVGNKFNGLIPTYISKFPNLELLDLSDNNFIGPIPRSNLVKLKHLYLSNNKLEGEIPGWIGKVSEVLLDYNFFTSFEKSFEVSANMSEIDWSSNSFQGPLPPWICKIKPSTVYLLDLSNNSFIGSIPQ